MEENAKPPQAEPVAMTAVPHPTPEAASSAAPASDCAPLSPVPPPFVAPPPPPDPRIEQVRVALQQQMTAQRNPLRNLAGLLLSLVLFVVLCHSQFSMTLPELLVLTGVVFLHELGHSAGMWLAGYKNIRILFIPLLGGATIGTDVRPSAAKNVIMSLMGPVPGIILGAVLAIYYADHYRTYSYAPDAEPLLYRAVQMLVFVNLFNLLPVNPLDGYRVVEGCLFARRPTADLVVKLVMASLVGLIALALFLVSWQAGLWVGLFALAFLLLVPMQYRWAKVAVDLARRVPPGVALRGDDVPEPYLTHLLNAIWTRPAMRKASPKTLATMVRNIWQRVCVREPSAAGAVVLLLLYLWCFLGGIALSFYTCFMALENVAPRPTLNSLVPSERMSQNVLGALIVYVFPMLVLAIVALFRRLFGRRQGEANP